MTKIKSLFSRLLYSVVIPTGLIVASFYIFNSIGNIPFLAATAMAFAIGFFAVYLAFKYWIDTGTDHDTPQQQMARFMIVFVVNLAINTEVVYLLVAHAQVDALTAQTTSSVIVAYISYYAYRSLVFRSTEKKTIAQELSGSAAPTLQD